MRALIMGLAVAGLAGCASVDGAADSRAVTRFVERAEMCQHFAGEEPYDAERREEINRNLDDLRCATVIRDGQALKVSRRDRPEDQRRIDEALAAFT